ncbi:MAG: PilN domain-containing protein [Omnitrophica bacterium]|nr:PilN domain-containing protein [Candidatus Omnitrophota bacterium]
MKNKKTLIIGLNERLIKVCQIDNAGQKNIFCVVDTQEVFGELKTKDLEVIFSKFPPEKYENVIISLPRSFFLIRFLKLPSIDREEIKKMLPFQLVKTIPYSLDEVIYDFFLVEQKENVSKVVIFIIQNRKMDFLLGFIKKTKSVFANIAIADWGLYLWMLWQGKFSKARIKYPAVVIDIDRYRVNFLIANKDGIIFSRSFAYADDGQIAEGIEDSLMIFEKEFSKVDFSSVIFSGIKKEELLGGKIFAKAIFIPAQDNFSLGQDAAKGVLARNSLASLFGFSTVKNISQFDFSPPLLKEKRKAIEKRRRYFMVGVMAVEIISLCFILLCGYILDRHLYLKSLNSKLKGMKLEFEEIDTVVRKLKVLDKKFFKKSSFAKTLYVLLSSLPGITQVTYLDFQENGVFSLKGYAANIAGVFGIVKSLNDSGIFEKVKIKHASQVERKASAAVEFYIQGIKK